MDDFLTPEQAAAHLGIDPAYPQWLLDRLAAAPFLKLRPGQDPESTSFFVDDERAGQPGVTSLVGALQGPDHVGGAKYLLGDPDVETATREQCMRDLARRGEEWRALSRAERIKVLQALRLTVGTPLFFYAITGLEQVWAASAKGKKGD